MQFHGRTNDTRMHEWNQVPELFPKTEVLEKHRLLKIYKNLILKASFFLMSCSETSVSASKRSLQTSHKKLISVPPPEILNLKILRVFYHEQARTTRTFTTIFHCNLQISFIIREFWRWRDDLKQHVRVVPKVRCSWYNSWIHAVKMCPHNRHSLGVCRA